MRAYVKTAFAFILTMSATAPVLAAPASENCFYRGDWVRLPTGAVGRVGDHKVCGKAKALVISLDGSRSFKQVPANDLRLVHNTRRSPIVLEGGEDRHHDVGRGHIMREGE